MLVCFFTARSETCAGESASPQIWPPSHWSPSGWPPEGRILKGHSSGKKKQHGNVSQVCRLTKVGQHDSVWTHLQVCASERGPSQVAVLQFGVLQRGHSQVDSCHLTSLHVHTLKIGSYTHTHVRTHFNRSFYNNHTLKGWFKVIRSASSPSKLALIPAGSSKLQPLREAPSALVHSIFTPCRLAA